MELYDQKLVIAHYEKFQEYLQKEERLDQEIDRVKQERKTGCIIFLAYADLSNSE